VGRAFQPAIIGISKKAGWKACPTKEVHTPEYWKPVFLPQKAGIFH
jgi:hypothetical protein